MSSGTIYLVPCPLGEDKPVESLPIHTLEVVRSLKHFVVEHPKTARHFIKACEHPEAIQSLDIDVLDKKTEDAIVEELIQPCLEGHDVGVISEAGCPGVADPGSKIVKLAHQKNLKVVPLIGPSSILQALMASGFNGQSFAFHGYLSKDKDQLKRQIKRFEKHIRDYRQTQLFIETPYRTDALLNELIKNCPQDLLLGVAAQINQVDERIEVKRVSEWKKGFKAFGKVPAVFTLFS